MHQPLFGLLFMLFVFYRLVVGRSCVRLLASVLSLYTHESGKSIVDFEKKLEFSSKKFQKSFGIAFGIAAGDLGNGFRKGLRTVLCPLARFFCSIPLYAWERKKYSGFWKKVWFFQKKFWEALAVRVRFSVLSLYTHENGKSIVDFGKSWKKFWKAQKEKAAYATFLFTDKPLCFKSIRRNTQNTAKALILPPGFRYRLPSSGRKGDRSAVDRVLVTPFSH